MKTKVVLALLFILLFTIQVQALEGFREFAIDRFLQNNHSWVDSQSNLNEWDKATKQQATDRVDSLIYWSKEFNHMYPDIDYERVIKDSLEIMLHETRGVNYTSRIDSEGNRSGVLDGGQSFGIWSMTWRTAYWIASVNGWELNNRQDEIRLMQDTHMQTKYAVWLIYWLYQYMDMRTISSGVELDIKDIRYAVIDGYNLPSVDPTKPRARDYFFIVYGRIKFQEERFKYYKGDLNA